MQSGLSAFAYRWLGQVGVLLLLLLGIVLFVERVFIGAVKSDRGNPLLVHGEGFLMATGAVADEGRIYARHNFWLTTIPVHSRIYVQDRKGLAVVVEVVPVSYSPDYAQKRLSVLDRGHLRWLDRYRWDIRHIFANRWSHHKPAGRVEGWVSKSIYRRSYHSPHLNHDLMRGYVTGIAEKDRDGSVIPVFNKFYEVAFRRVSENNPRTLRENKCLMSDVSGSFTCSKGPESQESVDDHREQSQNFDPIPSQIEAMLLLLIGIVCLAWGWWRVSFDSSAIGDIGLAVTIIGCVIIFFALNRLIQ